MRSKRIGAVKKINLLSCIPILIFSSFFLFSFSFLFSSPLFAATLRDDTLGVPPQGVPSAKSTTTPTPPPKSPPAKRSHTHRHLFKPLKSHFHRMMPPIEYTPVWLRHDRTCMTSHDLNILVAMTQNLGRALPNPCNPIWPMPIALSAGVNIDGKFGKLNGNLMGTNVQSISVNDAYINAIAIANFWMNGFASISIGNPTVRTNPATFGRLGAAEYSAAYSNNIAGRNKTRIQLEQAYATIGDITRFPLFIQVGKGFQDYGRYRIHPMTRSMTQVMSETLALGAKLGWIYNGFNGSIYAFENHISRFDDAPSNRGNYGIAVGFDQPACAGFCYRWSIGGAYLYNLMGVNDIAYNVVNFTRTDHYHHRVGGTSIYGDIYNGPFTLHARYTVAILRFDVFDLPRNGAADFVNRNINESVLLAPSTGAKPWSADFLAGYHFNELFCKHQTLYLGYQVSRQAAALNLPRARYLVGYDINAFPATTLGIEWEHDLAYTHSGGSTGHNGDLVTLRASVAVS